jgi:hypothetical protein
MKKAFLVITMFLGIASLPVVAGNNNGNNNTDQSKAAVIDQPAVDPYATSISVEVPIPGCKGPKHPDMICTAQYQPVCGCDGKTYSNACVATREGVLIYVPGECGSLPPNCFDPTVINPSCICPAVYDPVCACGVITFSNACVAQCAGFINTTPGPCVPTGQ